MSKLRASAAEAPRRETETRPVSKLQASAAEASRGGTEKRR